MKFSLVGLSLLALFNGAVARYSTSDFAPDGYGDMKPKDRQFDPRLVMYVQTFKQPDGKPLSLLPLLQHKTRVTHVVLASVHLHEEPGEIMLNNDPFTSPVWDTMWEEVRALQWNGVHVMLLLGGAAGGTYKRLNGTDEEFYSYYRPLLHLIHRYNINGIDIDIEEEVDISVPFRLMAALRRDLGRNFIITMTPLASALSDKRGQNLSKFSYFDLEAFATVPGSDEKLVNWYNGLFYGGFARGPPFFQSVVEAGWDPSRVVMVVLDCANDGQPNGFVRIEALQKTIRDLRNMYPGFGGVGGWEYHDAGMSDGDIYEPWNWVRRVADALFDSPPAVTSHEELK